MKSAQIMNGCDQAKRPAKMATPGTANRKSEFELERDSKDRQGKWRHEQNEPIVQLERRARGAH